MDTKTAVLQILRSQDGTPIKRDSLRYRVSTLVGRPVNDRCIRLALAKLAFTDLEGHYIVGSTKGGYCLGSRDQLIAYLARENKKARSILARVSRQAKTAKVILDGQMEVGV